MEENTGKLEVGQIFKVLDENDQEQDMKIVGFLKVKEYNYAAVIFVEDVQEESEDDIGIFFLRVEEDNALSMIESEEEFEKVSAAFEKMEKDNSSKKRRGRR